MKKLIAIMAIAGMTSSLALAQAPTQSKDAGQPNVFTTVKDASPQSRIRQTQVLAGLTQVRASWKMS